MTTQGILYYFANDSCQLDRLLCVVLNRVILGLLKHDVLTACVEW
jgi:hypothetical protein